MNLNIDDVVSIEKHASFLGATTFTVKEASDKLAQFVQDKAGITAEAWKGDGVKCRVLQPGKGGWKEGRVRISLEFIPDEEEIEEAELVEKVELEENAPLKQLSPLDEFRQNN
ncbi:KGK domain family protein [Tolypothrix sp. NIES-4075]|uniref:KGK domain-containing protein n=1 Tax=Tolypothrix sp. NIES-4075 TaxID=2005459 RepID=UPI000B5CC8C1|nr:KGK domain-containing protein [Tolypothrix sp. NIES-4075]GAX43432.1 KGK domain family protein [Tolypothrix sp. NIES-4075]